MFLFGCIGLALALIVPNVIALYHPRLFVVICSVVAIALLCWGVLYTYLNYQSIFSAWRSRREDPLLRAAGDGDAARVRRLLERGVDADPRAPGQGIPLCKAARKGHTEVVRILLAYGAAVDARDSSGKTPLMIAVSDGRRDVAELLIDHGADVNARDDSGRTPLMAAVLGSFHREDGRCDVAQLLIDHGADVDAVSKSGTTALGFALARKLGDHVELLRARGATNEGRI